MGLKSLQRNWDAFGRTDPLWAVLTHPDKKGNKWEVDAFFETGVKQVDELMARIHQLVFPLESRRALDFGCGVGRLTRSLADHFARVDGVDIAPSMIEWANSYNAHPANCAFHVSTGPSLALFPDQTFDLVHSHITLQHIEPGYSKAYIKEFVRVLAPGGLVVFQLPSGRSSGGSWREKAKRKMPLGLLHSLRRVWHAGEPLMNMYVISQAEVVATLHAAGARLLAIEEDHSSGEDWPGYRYFATKP